MQIPKNIRNKFFLVFIGICIGATGALLAPKLMPKKKTPQDEILEMMEKFRQGGFAPRSQTEMKQKEDANSVTYEITIKGLASEEVRVSVKEGMIRIEGKAEVTSQNPATGATEQSTSRFQRYFPVPDGTDEKSVKIKQEKDKIMLTFAKKEFS